MTKKVTLNKKWKEVLFALSGFGPNLLMVLMGAYFSDAVNPNGLKMDVIHWCYSWVGEGSAAVGVPIVIISVFPILLFLAKSFDGIVDVPLAVMTDNLQNKTGKRWIGLILSIVPMIVSYALSWVPIFGYSPDITVGQQVGNSIWFIFWSLIFFASYTLGLITFYGSISDICENQTQSARVSIYKSVFDTISYAVGYALIPALLKPFNTSIWKVALIMTPLMITIMIPLLLLKKTDEKDVITQQKRISFGESLKITLKSKPFMRWTIVNCISFFGLQMFLVCQNALISGLMNLGTGQAALLNTCAFAPVPIMLVLFNKLRRKKGIRFAYQTALICFAVAIFSFGLGSEYIWPDQVVPRMIIGAVGAVIGSWGIGAFFMVPYLIPTQIASVEEEVTGKNHSAMYFAVQALFTSIVGAFASYIVYDNIKNIVEHPENLSVRGGELGWRYGVSLVPLIVAIACLAGFIACFFMPKQYNARVIYEDLKETAQKRYDALNRKRESILRHKENKTAAILASRAPEAKKQLLLKKVELGYGKKLEKVEKLIEEPSSVINLNFDENKSAGSEENYKIERNGILATTGLFVLSGGLSNIIYYIFDLNKLKVMGKKAKWWQIVIIAHSFVIPFLNIYTTLFYLNRIEEYAKEHNIKLKTHKALCVIVGCFLPCFMNVADLIVRTNCFNKISESLEE